jgi:hypothetical protein
VTEFPCSRCPLTGANMVEPEKDIDTAYSSHRGSSNQIVEGVCASQSYEPESGII